MTNKNLPDTRPDKNTTGTNPTDRRTNETPAGANTEMPPVKDGKQRGAEGTTMDRGNTANAATPGRDIITGVPGGDGTNRKMPNDSNKDAADAGIDVDKDAAEVDDEKEEEEKDRRFNL